MPELHEHCWQEIDEYYDECVLCGATRHSYDEADEPDGDGFPYFEPTQEELDTLNEGDAPYEPDDPNDISGYMW